MRYVRHFNQEWYEELLQDFRRCYEELHYKLSGYNNTVVRNETPIRPTPVQIKDQAYPFPIAEKVQEIYEWLCGERRIPPKHLEHTLYDLLSLAYFNPFLDPVELASEIEWERWKSLPIGFFYQTTEVAYKLYKGQSINASELALLTHVSQVAVLKQIKTKKFPAKKDGNTWRIEPRHALEWIETYNEQNPYVGKH